MLLGVVLVGALLIAACSEGQTAPSPLSFTYLGQATVPRGYLFDDTTEGDKP